MGNDPSNPTAITGSPPASAPAPGPDPLPPPCISASVVNSVSARDRELLASIDDPEAPLDPFEYAAFLKRPEIREALAAIDEVTERRERAKERRDRDFRETEARHAAALLRKAAEDAKALDDKDRIAETRRAATQLLRLSRGTGFQPVSSLRRAAGAPPSPPGRGPEAMRSIAQGVRAPSTPDSPTAPPGPDGPATNPHSLNTEAPHSESPSVPSAASAFKSLPPLLPHAEKKVAAFLRAAGQPVHMRRHSAEHWVQAFGGEDEFLRYLESLPLDFIHAQLERATFNPEGDQATVPVDYTQRDGSLLRGRVYACVECNPDTFEPIRWAVNGLELDPPQDQPPPAGAPQPPDSS